MKMDLGKSPESSMEASPAPKSPETPEKYYPTLHIDGSPEDFADLPDSGQMTVTFKKTSHSTSTSGGKASATVGLDILSIENVESDEEEAMEEEDTGAALDKAAEAEKAAAEEQEE